MQPEHDNDPTPQRILTRRQYAKRMALAASAFPIASPTAHQLAADSAAMSSNRQCNPEIGRDEWLTDTPDWIRAIPRKRGWFNAADYEENEHRITKTAQGGDRS